MSTVLTYSPGQTATIFWQVTNIDGYRVDGYGGPPTIARVIIPNLTQATGYPIVMTRLDVGLFIYSFPLPIGAISVGSYLVDIQWFNPDTLQLQEDFVQIVVNSPYGTYSVIPVG
jgi:hypothetical protein